MVWYFSTTFDLFQQRYNHNPLALYHVVRHCLHEEMNLLHKADMVSKNVLPFFLPQISSPRDVQRARKGSDI